MEFLLLDTGMALAALLGYRAFVVLTRHRAQAVTLARGVTVRARADQTRGNEVRPNRHKDAAKPRVTYLDVAGVDPRRLVNLR